MDIERARFTHNTAIPLASTEALESMVDFSGFAYKIPGQGSDWSNLDHVYMSRPIRMARNME